MTIVEFHGFDALFIQKKLFIFLKQCFVTEPSYYDILSALNAVNH